LFELAKKPEYAKKLHEALESHVSQSPDAEIFHDQISTIELLDGVIWEALRLFPPNPSHPTRVTPAEGAMIAGRFVASGTQVMAPQYVIGRGKWFFCFEATICPVDAPPQTKASIPERLSLFLNVGTALHTWSKTRRQRRRFQLGRIIALENRSQ
jgi:hypothetical protein